MAKVYDGAGQFNIAAGKDLGAEGLIDWLESGYAFGMRTRFDYERMALLSMLFWGGQQWTQVVADNLQTFGRRDVWPDQCEEVRRVNNQIPMHTRDIVSGMLSNLPMIEAEPATHRPEDVEGAKVSSSVIKWRDRKDQERVKRQLELQWMMGCGEVLRRTWWDPDGDEGNGDIATEVVGFFRYVKDPYSVDVWPPRWLIEFDARTVEEVRDMYDVKDLEPEGVSDAMADLDRLASNVMTSRGASTRESQKNSVILKRMCVPPSKRYPKGHYWVFASGKVLDEHNLQSGRFPYSRGQWFPIPGRLYALSLIELILTDQRYLNTLLSQMGETVAKQLRHDIVTAGVKQDATEKVIDAKSGRKQIQLPTGITKWDFLQYDVNWQGAQVAYEQVINDIRNKAGQSMRPMSIDLKRQVRVGELQLAREADFQSLSWHMDQYAEDHLCEISGQKLELTHDYVKDVRLVTLFGEPDADRYFTGADLRDTRNVVTIPTPNLTPAMKRQAQVQAREMKLTGPFESPQDELSARLTLKYMGLSDMEDELSKVYGPLEELQALVQQIEQKRKQAALIQADTAIDAAVMQKAGLEAQAQQLTGQGQQGSGEAGGGQEQPGAAQPLAVGS